MPGFNGTGPNGRGSMTGRGMGRCNDGGNRAPGFAGRGLGRGAGRGLGRGAGQGLGRGFGYNTNVPSDKESLKNIAKDLKSDLDYVNNKLKETESEE